MCVGNEIWITAGCGAIVCGSALGSTLASCMAPDLAGGGLAAISSRERCNRSCACRAMSVALALASTAGWSMANSTAS